MHLKCFPDHCLLNAKYLWCEVDLKLRALRSQLDRALFGTVLLRVNVDDLISVRSADLAAATDHAFIMRFLFMQVLVEIDSWLGLALLGVARGMGSSGLAITQKLNALARDL